MITESCYNVNPEREHVLVDNLKFADYILEYTLLNLNNESAFAIPLTQDWHVLLLGEVNARTSCGLKPKHTVGRNRTPIH